MKLIKVFGILGAGFLLSLIVFPFLDTLRDHIYSPTDQAMYDAINTGDDANALVQGDTWACQSFVASDAYMADSVRALVWLSASEDDGTLDVGLYHCYATGIPYGTALAAGQLSSVSLDTTTPGTWKIINLSEDVELSDGGVYGIVMNYDNASTEYVNWRIRQAGSTTYRFTFDAGETWYSPADTSIPLPPPTEPADDTTYGSGANDTGEPVGGGYGYSTIYTAGGADYVVTTGQELLDALAVASSGNVVFVPENATINLSGQTDVAIPDGVILAGNRGATSSNDGGLVFSSTTTGDNYTPLFVLGTGSRVTGLRLRGPDGGTAGTGALYYCLDAQAENTEIDNCEIYNWPYAAVATAGCSYPGRCIIACNDIHNCQRAGYGSGVNVALGYATIVANEFDYCWHVVLGARSGPAQTATSFEAYYNVLGANAGLYDGAFDIRGGNDDADMGFTAGPDCDYAAGGEISIHHNTCKASAVAAVRVRGVPATSCTVEYNWFYHEAPPWAESTVVVQQVDNLVDLGCASEPYYGVTVGNNWYGETAP